MIKNNFNWNNLNSVKRSYLIYGCILVGFIIWMVFIDSHSLIIHSELNKEIKKLESEKKALEAIINNDKNQGKNVTQIGAMAKLFASEACVKIATEAVQIHGGYGFTKDFPVEKFLRESKLCTIGEGTSEIQKVEISRNLLK